MKRDVLIERFFTVLTSGDRVGARAILDEILDADCPAERVLTRLFWPTLEHIQKLYRADQLSELAHNYATRLMRALAEQMQLRLSQAPRREMSALVACGRDQGEELGALISAALLEAEGYDVFFVGGGIANDELVEQINLVQPNILVMFGAIPATVPLTRLLIDRLHSIGACPQTQIVVGGGVFNRAEGLAEEIGADLWAQNPEELVNVIIENPQRRMSADQRTVGRKRRPRRDAA
ncbi:MAG: hypothetical protein CMJ20_11115 [Phycisphaeraceae bacterium]|nr:hypothetical protein [Phycisphaeraceae bacterium]